MRNSIILFSLCFLAGAVCSYGWHKVISPPEALNTQKTYSSEESANRQIEEKSREYSDTKPLASLRSQQDIEPNPETSILTEQIDPFREATERWRKLLDNNEWSALMQHLQTMSESNSDYYALMVALLESPIEMQMAFASSSEMIENLNPFSFINFSVAIPLVENMALTDPQESLALLAQLADANPNKFTALQHAAMKVDEKAKILAGNKQSIERLNAQVAYEEALKQILIDGPSQEFEVLFAQASGSWQERLLSNLAVRMAQQSCKTALSYKFSDTQLTNRFQQHAVAACMKQSHTKSEDDLAVLFEVLQKKPQLIQGKVIEAAGSLLQKNSTTGEINLQYFEKVYGYATSSQVRNKLAKEVVLSLSLSSQPEHALVWLAKIDDEEARSALLPGAVSSLSTENSSFKEHIDIIDRLLSDKSAREKSYRSSIRLWQTANPKSVIEFIEQLKNSERKQQFNQLLQKN